MQPRNASEMNLQEAVEKDWVERYRLFEADRDFRWARVRTLVRWIAARRVVENPRSAGSCVGMPMDQTRDDQGILRAPIDRIVGTVDATGTKVSPLPPLRRRHLAAWRHEHMGADPDASPALALRAAEDGYYLTGTDGAFVTLEVARAKKLRSVKVRLDSPNGCVVRCREAEEECPIATLEHAACCGA